MIDLEFKFDGETGQLSGYASTFGGPPDSYGDVVAPRAFAASLAAHKKAGTAPLMLWAHDARDLPIGTWTTLTEDRKGLHVEGQLNLDLAKARDVLSSLKAKSFGGLSIGFRAPPGGRERKADGTALLRTVDLVEISLVNVPANRSARILSAKSELTERLAHAIAELKEVAHA